MKRAALSYGSSGSPTGNRTPVTAVKGPCLNRLTMGPKNRLRPTFPGSFPPSIIGSEGLNYCVRDGNRCNPNDIATRFFAKISNVPSKLNNAFKNHWSSVRPISIGQLNMSPCLHLRPINVVVSHGPYHKEEICSCGGLRT